MASVKNKDIPKDYEFFGELFNFRKKFYLPEDNQSYWNELIEETNKLSEKWNSEYVDGMLVLCVDEIDKRYHETHGTQFKRGQITLTAFNGTRRRAGLKPVEVLKNENQNKVSQRH